GVKPTVDCAVTTGQIAIAGLLRTIQPVRTSVGGIFAYLWCEIETGMQGNDATDMPAAQYQVCDPSGVEVALPFSDRELIVKATDPTKFLVKVRTPVFVAQVVCVLRCGRGAADFRLIVKRFAESK